MSYVHTSDVRVEAYQLRDYNRFFPLWDVSPYRKRCVMDNCFTHFIQDMGTRHMVGAFRGAGHFLISRGINDMITLGAAFTWLILDDLAVNPYNSHPSVLKEALFTVGKEVIKEFIPILGNEVRSEFSLAVDRY